MPKVTLLFKGTSYIQNHPEDFYPLLGQASLSIRKLVAAALSTDSVPLEIVDVDFLPFEYPQGTRTYLPVSIEIETIGYAERKANLTKECLLKLKSDILTALDKAKLIQMKFWEIKPDDPLVWLRYQDPDGFHL